MNDMAPTNISAFDQLSGWFRPEWMSEWMVVCLFLVVVGVGVVWVTLILCMKGCDWWIKQKRVERVFQFRMREREFKFGKEKWDEEVRRGGGKGGGGKGGLSGV